MVQKDERTRRPPVRTKRSRLTTRLIWQLAVAVTLFGLWLGLRQEKPETAHRWQEQLSRLMSSSADLREACDQLGEDLSRGEDLAVSVGNWCETVFLPKTESDEPEG